MKTILRLISFISGFILGFQLASVIINFEAMPFVILGITFSGALAKYAILSFFGIIGGFIGIILLALFVRTVDSVAKDWAKKLRAITIPQLIVSVGGLIISLIVAALVSNPVYKLSLPEPVRIILTVLIYLGLGYGGLMLCSQKWNDIESFFRNRVVREKNEELPAKQKMTKKVAAIPKILDTSVIIDGRIFDILRTGFLEGPVIITNFVLDELQLIADSADGLKRNRGRRGLDILSKIQKELPIEVIISDRNYADISEVDTKLLKLALEMKGKVVTNDYNLNKIAELQGVEVLNTNDLSNAVKSVVLPGEEMHVQIIKEGKEHNQGVAYLDDGTMIVIEGGKTMINKNLNVVVTSVLQTSAGRMVFAKPVI